MQATIVPGVSAWSLWQPDRNVFFNSHFVRSDDGNAIIDPLPLGDADAAEIAAAGGARYVFVTNRDHERDARAVAERFGAQVLASAPEAAVMSGRVDRTLDDGEVVGKLRAITLDGMKSPCELALALDAEQAVIVGDALWGAPAGSLSLPPKVNDAGAALLSLRKIVARRPRHLLVGDGASIYHDAYDAIHRFFATQDAAYSSRINHDALHYDARGPTDPAGYSSGAEIGEK